VGLYDLFVDFRIGYLLWTGFLTRGFRDILVKILLLDFSKQYFFGYNPLSLGIVRGVKESLGDGQP